MRGAGAGSRPTLLTNRQKTQRGSAREAALGAVSSAMSYRPAASSSSCDSGTGLSRAVPTVAPQSLKVKQPIPSLGAKTSIYPSAVDTQTLYSLSHTRM